MKKIFLIVTVLSLTAFAANAQKYGFYGNGAAKTQRSYHNGVSGTYVGYHPAGVSNSHATGSTASRRSGFSAPTVSATSYNPMESKRTSGSSLGLSTGLSGNNSGSGFSSGSDFSSGSTGVIYGRTSSSSASSTSFGVTISAMPEQMASTTNSDKDGETTGFFAEFQGGTPDYKDGAPIGDAILPLLLLLIPVVVLKVRKH